MANGTRTGLSDMPSQSTQAFFFLSVYFFVLFMLVSNAGNHDLKVDDVKVSRSKSV